MYTLNLLFIEGDYFDLVGHNCSMREIIKHIDEVKRRVGLIVGQPLTFEVNKGRNKFVKFDGYIQDAYPAIFTVRCMIEGEEELLSYSYNDILTRNVWINKK